MIDLTTFLATLDVHQKAEVVIENIIAALDRCIARGRPDEIDIDRWERFLVMRDEVVPILRADPEGGVLMTAEFLREKGFTSFDTAAYLRKKGSTT